LETNMEIQRRALVLAIRRVDKTREDLNKPPAPAKPTQPGQPAEPVETLGPTVAFNLTTALNDLQGAQNTFMSVVLNHYENRMLLYRELGIMQLDDCGMWIDRPIEESDGLTDDQCPMPPSVPAEWLEDAGVGLKDMIEGPSEQPTEPSKDEADAIAARSKGRPESRATLGGKKSAAVGKSARGTASLPLAQAGEAEPGRLNSMAQKVSRWVRPANDEVSRERPTPAGPPPSEAPREGMSLPEAMPKERADGAAFPSAGPILRR
jgi:hypothetical protein